MQYSHHFLSAKENLNSSVAVLISLTSCHVFIYSERPISCWRNTSASFWNPVAEATSIINSHNADEVYDRPGIARSLRVMYSNGTMVFLLWQQMRRKVNHPENLWCSHPGVVLCDSKCVFGPHIVIQFAFLCLPCLSSNPLAHTQWTEAGHPGRTGPPVTYAAVEVCRNVLALAPIPLLSMAEPSVRACRCRRAHATPYVQVRAIA